ncbi:MAG: AAA family ATPase [Thermoplasmata archaeon]
MIIVVVGMPGSGKDVFVRAAMDVGFSKVSMGDVVRHFASLSGLGSDDASIGGFAGSQRREHGPAIWAQRTLDIMPDGNVIIDGSRSLDEMALFRERLGGNLKVVAIAAPPEKRFERLQSRRRQDDPADRENFNRRDERELSWGLGRAIGTAEITLVNDGTLEDFQASCRNVLRDVLARGD